MRRAAMQAELHPGIKVILWLFAEVMTDLTACDHVEREQVEGALFLELNG